MTSILVFAGTTEGRTIAEYLRGHAPQVYVCTATEYGKELVEEGGNIHVLAGRLDIAGMKELAEECRAELVIDATHPFATEVTANIRAMCQEAHIAYIRALREGSVKDVNAVWVRSVREAAAYLADKTGNILITTGSKELEPYTKIPDFKERCFLRVLSTKEAVEQAAAKGFQGKHLIAMQGPFSQAMNEQLIAHVNARYLVTKESGRAGGYEEKLRAAQNAGAVAVVIGRPAERGLPVDEICRILAGRYGIRTPKKIFLIGIGPGGRGCLTKEAQEAVDGADVLIGAKRMLEAFLDVSAEHYEEYRADKILEYIRRNSRCRNIAVLLSGDVSFYSGAAKLKEVLGEYEVSTLPGISSVSYMAARIGEGIEHTPLLSIHGRNCNYIDYLREYGRIYLLVSAGEDIEKFLKKLCRYGFGDADVWVGEELSYRGQKIRRGKARKLAAREVPWKPLSVIFARLPEKLFQDKISTSEDAHFIRGKVPMTKSEVREVILSKVNPERESVIYDVGAGTGSVAIALAERALAGTVYAVEKSADGIGLIHQNKRRFHVSNVHAVHGTAPGALSSLPAPDLVFVGGSSGNLEEILDCVWEKNPGARIVVSAVTAETFAQCVACGKRCASCSMQIVQVQVSRGKKAGRYHLMEAQNPVYIVTYEREKGEETAE